MSRALDSGLDPSAIGARCYGRPSEDETVLAVPDPKPAPVSVENHVMVD